MVLARVVHEVSVLRFAGEEAVRPRTVLLVEREQALVFLVLQASLLDLEVDLLREQAALVQRDSQVVEVGQLGDVALRTLVAVQEALVLLFPAFGFELCFALGLGLRDLLLEALQQLVALLDPGLELREVVRGLDPGQVLDQLLLLGGERPVPGDLGAALLELLELALELLALGTALGTATTVVAVVEVGGDLDHAAAIGLGVVEVVGHDASP